MFAIGDSLREARTRRGLSAADVQKGIRIRERYLTALEEERWEMLPGEAYIKGFLRTYAEFLGLNGNLYIDEYNARIAHHDAEPPLVPESLSAAHRPKGGVLRTVVAILVLGALVAGLAAWRLGGSTKPTGHAHAAAQAALVAVSDQSAQAAAEIPSAKPRPAAVAKPKHVAAAPAVAGPTKTTIKAARGRSWLSIRVGGPNGRELYRGTLERGQTLHYHLAKKLWVRMGRPLMLDITVAGHAVHGLTPGPGNVLLTHAGPQAA